MTTTHDDNATTWRDLADALTPEQIAHLEDREARPETAGRPAPFGAHEAGLLFTAREYVQQNAAGAFYADVAPPPEDGKHFSWEFDGDGTWSRYFVGTTRTVGHAEVAIAGTQSADGSISRAIDVDHAEGMDVETARRVAAALLEAADELDGL